MRALGNGMDPCREECPEDISRDIMYQSIVYNCILIKTSRIPIIRRPVKDCLVIAANFQNHPKIYQKISRRGLTHTDILNIQTPMTQSDRDPHPQYTQPPIQRAIETPRRVHKQHIVNTIDNLIRPPLRHKLIQLN